MPFATAQELLEIFDSGTTITIPGGFTQVEIWAIGAGGPARKGGGGGGGVAYKKYSILESEWGTNLTISIGASVAGSAGGNTTVNGTLNGSAITELKGFGGARASTAVGGLGGAGGTASGGDTNTTGEAGTDFDSETETYGVGGKILDQTRINITTNAHYGAGGPGAASPTETVGYGGAIVCFWSL